MRAFLAGSLALLLGSPPALLALVAEPGDPVAHVTRGDRPEPPLAEERIDVALEVAPVLIAGVVGEASPPVPLVALDPLLGELQGCSVIGAVVIAAAVA